MRVRVEFTDESRDDLVAIQAWISRSAPRTALEFVLRLTDAAEALKDSPRAGTFLPAFKGVRRIQFKTYYIYYRFDTAAAVVQILRFWHTARGSHPSGF